MSNKTAAPEFSQCPYCGGTEFCEAKSNSSDGQVTRVGTIIRSSPLVHVICLQCGSVIHSRVENVEALLTREEKEQRK